MSYHELGPTPPDLGQVLVAEEERFEPVAERILEAARVEFEEHGLRRTSLDDIARRAGVSRATLFRRFNGRDALIWTLAVRETRRAIAIVDEQVAGVADPEERIVAAFLACMRVLADDDLVGRLIETDPEAMLPLLAGRGTVVLAIGRSYLTAVIGRLRDDGLPVAGDPAQIAELLGRIALSLALNADTVLPLDDEDALERVARTAIVPLVTGPRRRKEHADERSGG